LDRVFEEALMQLTERLAELTQIGNEYPDDLRNITLLDRPELIDIQQLDKNDGDAWYIDGGNATVFDYWPFLVELNRMVAVRHTGLHKTSVLGPFTFLSLTYRERERLQTVTFGGPSFLSSAASPRHLNKVSNPSDMKFYSGRARRTAELALATKLAEADAKTVILDGNFGHSDDQAEVDYLAHLFTKVKSSGCTLFGLTKRTVIRKEGIPITEYTDRFMRKMGYNFYCARVGHAVRVNDTKSELFVCRLSSAGRKSYLVETLTPRIHDSVGILFANSAALHSPGFPAGLIEADRFARINQQEVKLLKLRLVGSFSADARLSPYLLENYSHDLLDLLNA
jgi:hypothetical protein